MATYVNIGSVNLLLSDGTKSSPGPMLTTLWWGCVTYKPYSYFTASSLQCDENVKIIVLKSLPHLPRGLELGWGTIS